MADIRRMYGTLCDVPNMYWNAIKVFTYRLDCLCYVFWVICGRFERDLRCERSGWFSASSSLEKGMETHMFGSEIGSGFREPCSTHPHPSFWGIIWPLITPQLMRLLSQRAHRSLRNMVHKCTMFRYTHFNKPSLRKERQKEKNDSHRKSHLINSFVFDCFLPISLVDAISCYEVISF